MLGGKKMEKIEALDLLERKSKSVEAWIRIVKDSDPLEPNNAVFSIVLKNVCSEFNQTYQKVKGFLSL